MTFWGSFLLGLEVLLQGLSVNHLGLEPVITGLGIVLTAFGFRRAIK